MFLLYEMEREIRVDPQDIGFNREQVIREEINRRYSNRVMSNIGLCMALWDIKSIGTGYVYPGDGAIHAMVRFQYVVFKPYQDEILEGKIKNCTADGVQITMQFFDDILIPAEGLQFPSRFDKREQIWIWEYKTDDSGDVHEMFMERGAIIRFRVSSEHFYDTTPAPFAGTSGSMAIPGSIRSQSPVPTIPTGGNTQSTANTPINELAILTNAPYCLLVAINEPGLGLLSWWS